MSFHLVVDGMTCGHCVTAITDALTPLPGVTDVAVDLADGSVEVSGTPQRQAVIEAVEAVGYDVRAS